MTSLQEIQHEPGNGNLNGTSALKKKQILLNAFDMSTIGHLSPGQWKVRNDLTNKSFGTQFSKSCHEPRR